MALENFKISVIGLIGLSLLAGCKGKTNETMAIVNGEQISREEFYAHLEHKPTVMINTGQGSITANVATPLNFQGLNDLINQKLLEQMAKDEEVFPTEKDIDNELSFQLTKSAGFIKTLTAQGYTVKEIRRQIALELCRYNLITKGIKISKEQVENYIKNNPKQFENPKAVDLLWVVVKDNEAKSNVDASLRSGENFRIVASRFSIAKDAQYPSRNYSQFPDRLKKIVDALPEGKPSDWLADGANQVRFYVDKKTEASKVQIKDWMKIEIERLLAQQKGSVAVDLDKRLLNKRKQANIDVQTLGLKEQFAKLSKSLKESDVKTGSSGK